MTIGVVLIVLHLVSGDPIEINPKLITHMRGPGSGNRLFTEGAKCLINFSDGKYITVKENCAEVRKLVEEGKP